VHRGEAVAAADGLHVAEVSFRQQDSVGKAGQAAMGYLKGPGIGVDAQEKAAWRSDFENGFGVAAAADAAIHVATAGLDGQSLQHFLHHDRRVAYCRLGRCIHRPAACYVPSSGLAWPIWPISWAQHWGFHISRQSSRPHMMTPPLRSPHWRRNGGTTTRP